MASADAVWRQCVHAAVERTLLLLGWERRAAAPNAARGVYAQPTTPSTTRPTTPPTTRPTTRPTTQPTTAPAAGTKVYGMELPSVPSWERHTPKLRPRPLAHPVARSAAPAWSSDAFSVGEHTGSV